MTYNAQRAVWLCALCATLSGCRTAAPAPATILPPPPLPTPRVASQWLALQSTVLALVVENRVTAADSSLQRFAREYARTIEGDRARWWRTLMRADTRAASGDASLALAQIDSLLTDSIALEVRTEAVLFRRSYAAIDSVRRLEVRRRTAATQIGTDRLDELKVARDSMARLTAEIDRLKKRLRAP
jgi:hypothetical protein